MSDFTVGNSYYTNLMDALTQKTGTSKVSTDLDRLTDDSTDEELMEACKSFESYFIEQMYKGMEKTIMRDEEHKENDYLCMFKDNIYQGYAKNTMDQGGFGIAKILYDSMKKNTVKPDNTK